MIVPEYVECNIFSNPWTAGKVRSGSTTHPQVCSIRATHLYFKTPQEIIKKKKNKVILDK